MATAAPAIASSTPATVQLANPYLALIQNGGVGPLNYVGIYPPGFDPNDNDPTFRNNYIDPSQSVRLTYHFAYTDGGAPAVITSAHDGTNSDTVYPLDADGNPYIDLTAEQIAQLNQISLVLITYLRVIMKNYDYARPQEAYLTLTYTDTLYGPQINRPGNHQTAP